MTDPWIAARDAFLYLGGLGVVAILAVFAFYLTHPDAQPVTEPQRPTVKPRCQAAHCGNAAMPDPVPHIDGTDMLVCPGCLDEGCREGWIVQEVAS